MFDNFLCKKNKPSSFLCVICFSSLFTLLVSVVCVLFGAIDTVLYVLVFFFFFSLALIQTNIGNATRFLSDFYLCFIFLFRFVYMYLFNGLFFLYTLSSSSFVVILLSYLFSCINVLRSGCWPSQAFLFSSLQPSSSPTSPFLPHCVFPSQAPGSMVT